MLLMYYGNVRVSERANGTRTTKKVGWIANIGGETRAEGQVRWSRVVIIERMKLGFWKLSALTPMKSGSETHVPALAGTAFHLSKDCVDSIVASVKYQSRK
jgi:hypothetical protein